jgi:endogenous inhibitor of DNA gyrase (YacG/DUF329 family)
MAKDPVTPLSAGPRRCPICGKRARHQPTARALRGHCFRRWLKGNYRVETEEPPDDPSGETEREAE